MGFSPLNREFTFWRARVETDWNAADLAPFPRELVWWGVWGKKLQLYGMVMVQTIAKIQSNQDFTRRTSWLLVPASWDDQPLPRIGLSICIANVGNPANSLTGCWSISPSKWPLEIIICFSWFGIWLNYAADGNYVQLNFFLTIKLAIKNWLATVLLDMIWNSQTELLSGKLTVRYGNSPSLRTVNQRTKWIYMGHHGPFSMSQTDEEETGFAWPRRPSSQTHRSQISWTVSLPCPTGEGGPWSHGTRSWSWLVLDQNMLEGVLDGGWAQPLWKIWKSVGIIISNWMEKYKMFQTTHQC